MQEIWLPSTTPNSKAVGRFVDIHDTYKDRAGNQCERVVTVLLTMIPGSNDVSSQLCKNNPDGEKLKALYPQAWELYQSTKTAPPAAEQPTATQYGIKGTPIESADFISRQRLGQLKLMGFLTLEQLAGMSDTVCQNVGSGAKALRKKAAEFLSGRPVQA